MSDLNDVILVELRDMRKEMNEGFTKFENRVSTVEAQIEPLFDNGTPGRITQIEDDVDDLKLKQARQFGWFAGAMATLEIAWHIVSHKLGLDGSLPLTH